LGTINTFSVYFFLSWPTDILYGSLVMLYLVFPKIILAALFAVIACKQVLNLLLWLWMGFREK
jgi:hypothetical protein